MGTDEIASDPPKVTDETTSVLPMVTVEMPPDRLEVTDENASNLPEVTDETASDLPMATDDIDPDFPMIPKKLTFTLPMTKKKKKKKKKSPHKEFFCGVCSIGFDEIKEFVAHIKEDDHSWQKNRALVRLVPGLGFCVACYALMQNELNWNDHINHIKHEKSVTTLLAAEAEGEAKENDQYNDPRGCETPGVIGKIIDKTQICLETANEYGLSLGGTREYEKNFLCGTCSIGFDVIEHFMDHTNHDEHIFHKERNLSRLVPGVGFCMACYALMQSELNWNNHSGGLKHKKSIATLLAAEALGMPPQADQYEFCQGCDAPGELGGVISSSDIDPAKAASYNFGHGGAVAKGTPIIGLQYITQISTTDNPFLDKFKCSLCDAEFGFDYRIKHMNGHNHKTRLLEKDYPDRYAHLMSVHVRYKSMKLLYHCAKVEEEEEASETDAFKELRTKFLDIPVKPSKAESPKLVFTEKRGSRRGGRYFRGPRGFYRGPRMRGPYDRRYPPPEPYPFGPFRDPYYTPRDPYAYPSSPYGPYPGDAPYNRDYPPTKRLPSDIQLPSAKRPSPSVESLHKQLIKAAEEALMSASTQIQPPEPPVQGEIKETEMPIPTYSITTTYESVKNSMINSVSTYESVKNSMGLIDTSNQLGKGINAPQIHDQGIEERYSGDFNINQMVPTVYQTYQGQPAYPEYQPPPPPPE